MTTKKTQKKRRVFWHWYGTRRTFWLVRLNAVYLKDLMVIEISAGLFGYGFLLQLFCAPQRVFTSAELEGNDNAG